MSEPGIDRESIVEALDAEWAEFAGLLSTLSPVDWEAPSPCPGWRVRDVVAHVIGTESGLDGQQAPATDVDVTTLPHVHNEIAAANERWVLSMRDAPSEQLEDWFWAITRRRLAALRSMSETDFAAPSWTPAGPSTYGRFMRIRLFDCWLHEQDVREALRRPGHDSGPCAELALDEIEAALGYLVGKRAQAPTGSSVSIRLTGPVRREFQVEVTDRARLVDRLVGPPTATLRLSSNLFTRLAGGRVVPEAHLREVELSGDEELGRRIASNLAFII